MTTLTPTFLIRSSSFLQVTRTCIKAWMSSNFDQTPTTDYGVSCPRASEKLNYSVTILAPSFLIGSSCFFIL